jgi:hypothetical protein
MTAMLIGLAWTYGTPFALYVLACLAACFHVSRATEANVSEWELYLAIAGFILVIYGAWGFWVSS